MTVSFDEVDVIVKRLRYKQHQDLLDDLAMGIIPPTAIIVGPPTAILEVEGSGGSAEVANPKSDV